MARRGSTKSSGLEDGVCAVWVHPFSLSLKDTGWWASFRSMPLIEYCVTRLAFSTSWPLILVAPLGGGRRTRDMADRCGITLCTVSTGSPVMGLSEAAQLLRVKRVLMVHGLLGVNDLFPSEFLRELVIEHLRARAAVTISAHLPAPLYAVVCERPVLRIISKIPSALSIPEDPAQVLEALIGATAKSKSGSELNVQRISFRERYGMDGSRLPKHIPWIYPTDRIILEQAANDKREEDPLARLASLRDLTVQQFERASRRTEPTTNSRRMKRTLRVLFASSPSAYSGGEQCLLNTIEGLKAHGGDQSVEVQCLAALDGLFAERLRERGVIVHCPQLDFAQPTAANVLRMDELLDNVKPDVVHCNAIVGCPLLAASRIRGIPLVQWVRVAQTDSLGEHLVFADRITAVSKFIATRLTEQMFRTDKTRVLYDAVDVDLFSPGTRASRDVRQQLGIDDADFVVLCIARFAPYKRHDVLARAAAVVCQRHPNLRLILIGEAQRGHEEYYNRCIKLIQELDLVRRTTVLEFDPNVLSIESVADAIVLCSEGEPLGTVVLEGMALAKPIIVAASGGLPEMITHGFSGLHCIPGDYRSLADQLSNLIEDRTIRDYLGKNARHVAVERFSLKVHARELLSVYTEVLGLC